MISLTELTRVGMSIAFAFVKSFVMVFAPKKKKDVSSDIVLVTGSAGRLGRLLSLEFAKLGAVLVLWDVNKQDNLETAKMIENIGGKAFAYTCDVSDRNQVYETAEKVKSQVGKVTILVNNAGILIGKHLLLNPDALIEKTFAVNALAHFWTVKAFLPDMMRMQKGHIVTISSLAGHFGVNRLVDYSTTSSAQIGFNNTLAAELRASGYGAIHTTLVCPFFIDTEMVDGAKSRFISVLTPESACKTIMESILLNDREVILPQYINLLIALSTGVPIAVRDIVHDLLINATSTMEEFKGRYNANKTE